ncbi:WG repeat-containing protein [Moraxella porci]|uniref:WG repeat-containing protein n=1 Tax=Moraxella porci TaxID=1288392 RepID=UPI00244A2C75|nr:WG repeat-containing protein [Moraxella porci]MDH2273255.1 WG repeat-containing protein [Moraxella porci]
MKQWLLCVSLGLSMSAMAMTDDSQQCEFLVEGGNSITDTHLGFADGVVSLEGCEEGLFVFSDTTSPQRQVGFVDKFGNQVIKPNPDIAFARPFRDGVAIVASLDGKFGLINPKGKWVLKPTYDSIFEFNHGVAIAVNKNGDDFDHALIDTTGREVIAMQSASIYEFGNTPIEQYLITKYENNHLYSGLYHKDGTVLIAMDRQTISYDEQTGEITVCHWQQDCH